MTTESLVQAGVTAIITGYLTWQKMRTVREEKKAQKAGLKMNPTRCKEHADAIECLDGKLDELRLDVATLHGDVRVLDARLTAYVNGKAKKES